MNNILTVTGDVPKWPLQPCLRQPCCGVATCGLAVDQDDVAVYECGLSKIRYLKWSDIQNRPGWNNGWPPGMGKSSGGVWKLLDCSDDMDMPHYPISDDHKQKCDCGAAAADYSISRDGGPGHSDWCKVYNKIVHD